MAYKVSQDFKRWYDYENRNKTSIEVKYNLYQWYYKAIKVDKFESVIKMIRKHENEILNFFKNGMTSRLRLKI